MSASLVGSEMCIRDRAEPRRPAGWHPVWHPRCPPQRDPPSEQAGGPGRPLGRPPSGQVGGAQAAGVQLLA
eukprot:14181130-Alexandrium_andersonii.AAC.1